MTAMPNVKTGTAAQIVESVAVAAIREQARWFEEKTGLVFPLVHRIDFSAKRRASWGGIRKFKPYVSIAVHRVVHTVAKNYPKHHFHEYASFRNSPSIGEFTGPWDKAIAADVAHEIAHAIQWYFEDDRTGRIRRALNVTAEFEKGHGDYFRQVYRAFRKRFVNHREFGISCVVIEEKKEVKAAQPKRAVKGIRMELSKAATGWFIHRYYDANGNLLGAMASKPKYASQGCINGKWETLIDPKTGDYFKNHPAARKFFIGQ